MAVVAVVDAYSFAGRVHKAAAAAVDGAFVSSESAGALVVVEMVDSLDACYTDVVAVVASCAVVPFAVSDFAFAAGVAGSAHWMGMTDAVVAGVDDVAAADAAVMTDIDDDYGVVAAAVDYTDELVPRFADACPSDYCPC